LPHPQHPSRLSSLQPQQVAPGYTQPEAESRNVLVDVPEPVNALTPATVDAPGTDAAAANKPKRKRSKRRHHCRRSYSSTHSSSPELRRHQCIKWHEFNGEMPFENFGADYLNCSENNCSTEKENVVYLKNTLVSKAKQVLWDTSGEVNTVDALTKHCKTKFRARRRRRPSARLDSLCSDLRKLSVLAHTDGHETFAVERFIHALGDATLKQ